MKKVLLIKTSSMGDVIHALPAMHDAWRVDKNISFDWLVEESFIDIPPLARNVDKVVPVAIRRLRKNFFANMCNGQLLDFKNALKSKYDIIIDAQGLLKSAILGLLAHGNMSGFDINSAREPLVSIFYKHKYHVPTDIHACERIRMLFALALNYSLDKIELDYGLEYMQNIWNKEAILQQYAINSKYVLFIHGTTWQSKHWRDIEFKKLANMLEERNIQAVIPHSNEIEYKRALFIQQNSRNVVVLPKLTLKNIMPLIFFANAAVAVDTGLGHLCAAFNTPCISLYGPTDPKLVGSYGKYQVHLRDDGRNFANYSKKGYFFNNIEAHTVLHVLQKFI